MKKSEIQQDEYLNPYDISIGDYKRGFLFNERENITVYCYRRGSYERILISHMNSTFVQSMMHMDFFNAKWMNDLRLVNVS